MERNIQLIKFSLKIRLLRKHIGKKLDNILIPNLFSDIIDHSNKPYFTNIENYIFFASSEEALKYIIDNDNVDIRCIKYGFLV